MFSYQEVTADGDARLNSTVDMEAWKSPKVRKSMTSGKLERVPELHKTVSRRIEVHPRWPAKLAVLPSPHASARNSPSVEELFHAEDPARYQHGTLSRNHF
jgi:hypothetical protein